MKKIINGGLAAAFIVIISISIVSCAGSGQAFAPVIPPDKGNGDTSGVGGGSGPKANILCRALGKCTIVISPADSASAAPLKKLTIQFVTARRIRKNKTITLYVAIDPATCPCCK